MATTIKIDPVTRIEGHLKIEVIVETVDGVQQVIDARSSGTMFADSRIFCSITTPSMHPISHSVSAASARFPTGWQAAKRSKTPSEQPLPQTAGY